MIWSLAALPFLAMSIYLWRMNMDFTAKLAALNTAADNAVAKIAADEAKIAQLSANQADPVKEQQIADAIDAVITKLGG